VVSLVGPLGAGKTVFAKGVAEGLGIPADALASPTFVIANEVPAPSGLRLVHADLYRVESEGELEAAGLLDWIERGTVLLVEWGDRFAAALPKDHLEVRIEPGPGAGERVLEARAEGPHATGILERWSRRWP
jgi:tRNA threonylcarbamoyladenosine biosynthesis protein TsaE